MFEIHNQLSGSRLVTAEILYHMPDHPGLLQSYIWQDYDLPPSFPELLKFLEFWHLNLEGALHSVKFACDNNIKAADVKTLETLLKIH